MCHTDGFEIFMVRKRTKKGRTEIHSKRERKGYGNDTAEY